MTERQERLDYAIKATKRHARRAIRNMDKGQFVAAGVALFTALDYARAAAELRVMVDVEGMVQA